MYPYSIRSSEMDEMIANGKAKVVGKEGLQKCVTQDTYLFGWFIE